MSHTKESVISLAKNYCVRLEDYAHQWCVVVMSIKRPKGRLFEYLRRTCTIDFLRQHVFILTDDEWYLDYATAQGAFFNVVRCPDMPRGVGAARKYTAEWCKASGFTYALCLDDDVRALELAFERNGGTAHTTRGDRQRYRVLTEQVIKAAVYSAIQMFTSYPTSCLGGIRPQHLSNRPHIWQTVADVNRGGFPMHAYFWAVQRMDVDWLYPLPACQKTGDDIMCCLQALARKQPVFILQWIMLDFISEQADSVVRSPNEEENRDLHWHEFDEIKKLQGGAYFKPVKLYPNGDYMYGTVDWARYYALYPAEPHGRYTFGGYLA